MSRTTCKWGILGTAGIARKNWQSIRDAGNARLVAVASRDVGKATAFVDECHAQVPHAVKPEAVGGYEALIERTDIDALYIPLPTGLRKDWVIRAAEAGKHVLIEKPIACNAADAVEMIAACENNRVQFMDGVMFLHTCRLKAMRAALDGGAIGDLRRITSQFSFPGGEDFLRENIRTDPALEPLGCLGDLGWYCVLLSLWAMDFAEPERVSGRILNQCNGVPTEFSGELGFADGVTAGFYNSFLAGNQQWANLSGTEGYLQVEDFVLPFKGDATHFSTIKSVFDVKGCQFDYDEGRRVHQIDESSSNAPGSQEAAMFRCFSQLVIDGRCDDSWPRHSLLTQRVLDACIVAARCA